LKWENAAVFRKLLDVQESDILVLSVISLRECFALNMTHYSLFCSVTEKLSQGKLGKMCLPAVSF
jgi:hypothetical protein